MAEHGPAPFESYPLHDNGGIVYTPLSREAAKTGQRERYRDAETVTVTLANQHSRATFRIPRDVTTYDVVPIAYEIEAGQDQPFPLGVQAVAYQDPAATEGDFCDLVLPGNIDLKVELLGSITAHVQPGLKHRITPDL